MYPSTIYWVQIDVLMSNTQSILSIKGQLCEPMSRVRESVINAYKSQGTKFLFLDYFLDDELMSTGKVSPKKGHDESHIDNTKLGT